jgi:flagellar motility protein MotE (MotC chaperone)
VAAATPAFPPAAAIGTAVTYMLKACRSVSADYDVVMVFFEDMNSFLERITILESRLPKFPAYRNCLMDVFTAFLVMTGIATKYIELGRFSKYPLTTAQETESNTAAEKWISNLMKGDDGDLGSSRKTMDTKLTRLQHATELAILGNSVEQLRMSKELQDNSDAHTQMLQEQKQMMGELLESNEAISKDVTKLVKMIEEMKASNAAGGAAKPKKPQGFGHGKPASANRIRNALPEVEGEFSESIILKETMLADSCSWLFAREEWEAWVSHDDVSRPLFAVLGQPGVGKSHLSEAMYGKLAQLAESDAENHTCAASFHFREERASLSVFSHAIVAILNQIAEKNAAVCEKMSVQFGKDDVEINVWEWRDLVTKLLGFVFSEKSKERLFVVLDGVDELNPAQRAFFTEFLEEIKQNKYRIYVAVTSRPEPIAALADQHGITKIEVTKAEQETDLNALVWSRLNSLPRLKRFSRYVKQRIADRLETDAPSRPGPPWAPEK